MPNTRTESQHSLNRRPRLKALVIISDVCAGFLFAVASLTALPPVRGVAIGCGTVVMLLAFHLPVFRLLLRLDRDAAAARGLRAVALSAADAALAAVFILWLCGIGAAARAVGMPMPGGLCRQVTSLGWYHFGMAALFVAGNAAWAAMARRRASGTLRSEATTPL